MNNILLDVDKFYVSPYDKFFAEFDATHENSAAQLQEIKKYERIFKLRDNPQPVQEEEIWEGF